MQLDFAAVIEVYTTISNFYYLVVMPSFARHVLDSGTRLDAANIVRNGQGTACLAMPTVRNTEFCSFDVRN